MSECPHQPFKTQRGFGPVTSSNHAMAWHCLRLAGVSDPVPAAGKLFELPAP
jgi:maleate cis-trans isomerase